MDKQTEPFIDDTLEIVGRDLSEQGGFTLFAIIRNEMYFLPQFVEHYRGLGVERFIIVDDGSTDGCLEYMAAQGDIMVMKSAHRFSDQIDAPKGHNKPRDSAMIAWRDTLFTRFGAGKWCIFVDLDEFIVLPQGMSFSNLAGQLPEGSAVVWGCMVDVYPSDWSDIIQEPAPLLNEVQWYFDGRPHIRLRKGEGQVPRTIYSGVRARLKYELADVQVDEPFKQKLFRKLTGNPYPRMEAVYKPCLVNWGEGFHFRGCHCVKGARALPIVLPILHFKFAPNFVSRFEYAIESGAYHNDSQSYKELKTLYQNMLKEGLGFEGPDSRAYRDFSDFEEAGIAVGFDANGIVSK